MYGVVMMNRGLSYAGIPVKLRRTAWAVHDHHELSEQTSWLLIATFHPPWSGLSREIRRMIQEYVVAAKAQEREQAFEAMLKLYS